LEHLLIGQCQQLLFYRQRALEESRKDMEREERMRRRQRREEKEEQVLAGERVHERAEEALSAAAAAQMMSEAPLATNKVPILLCRANVHVQLVCVCVLS